MTELRFKGKEFVYNHHLAVPFHPLVMHPEKGIGEPSLDGNLIIQGDNLHALKALLPHYAGKVKCIYIDPPYNKGSENWRYNDNVNAPMIQEWLAAGPIGRDDALRHDKWCAMMWPRLRLLKELLAEDGAIFVSIDDNEVQHLRIMMDEIFGSDNFIGSFIWEGTGKNDARFISVGHDYILCYAQRLETLSENKRRWRALKEGTDEIYEVAEKLVRKHNNDFEKASSALKKWFSSLDKKHKSWPHRHYNCIDAKGVYFPGDISWPGGGGPRYEVCHPETGNPVKIPARGWVFPAKETMLEAIEEGRVHFGKDEAGVPNLKRYLHETDRQVLKSVFYQDRRAAHKNLVKILREEEFEYPKDERIIQKLLEVVTSDDDIILDSFAGSGTTAHAVLALNREDDGNRKFILVECEDYADSVTAERVRRVIRGVPGAKDAALREGLGGAFTYCKLGAPLDLDKLLSGENLPSFEALGAALFHMATNRTFDPAALREADFYVGEADRHHIWLIYRPDCDWLKSDEAALTLTRAREFVAAEPEGKHLVFAAARFADRAILDEENLPVEFAPLPFALYRLDRS